MRRRLLLALQLVCVAVYLRPIRGAVVINTWPFTRATSAAFAALANESSDSSKRALDAITAGCNRCEVDQCDFTVGYGGSPDSNGETTLDAMILDGTTMAMGAVARLRRVKAAIRVARAVMDHSAHSVLAGDGALAFAKMMGFEEESLETPKSKAMHDEWRRHQCQPNYFTNVVAQNSSCPPYEPLPVPPAIIGSGGASDQELFDLISETNHDTIGMVVLSGEGRMAGMCACVVG
jgi:N4-(beta-N-acetylglucosaminyl)-L-asparaginase